MCEDINRIQLAKDRDQWQALVNMVMYFRVMIATPRQLNSLSSKLPSKIKAKALGPSQSPIQRAETTHLHLLTKLRMPGTSFPLLRTY
jgi:hypothetical protein